MPIILRNLPSHAGLKSCASLEMHKWWVWYVFELVMIEIFANERMAIKIVKISRYAAVLYAFKINYHTVSWEILSSGCKYRIYSKYVAVKLGNFIGLELVVNKIMIYEWSSMSVDKNWSKNWIIMIFTQSISPEFTWLSQV